MLEGTCDKRQIIRNHREMWLTARCRQLKGFTVKLWALGQIRIFWGTSTATTDLVVAGPARRARPISAELILSHRASSSWELETHLYRSPFNFFWGCLSIILYPFFIYLISLQLGRCRILLFKCLRSSSALMFHGWGQRDSDFGPNYRPIWQRWLRWCGRISGWCQSPWQAISGWVYF